jgi:Na+-driven multidrug efflux pump
VGLDGINSTVSGVLRGSGRQKLGAACNFVGYVSRAPRGARPRPRPCPRARRVAPPASTDVSPSVCAPHAAQWVIGLPLSWALAFPRGLGEVGLWAGLIAGAGVQAVVLLGLLLRWDWDAEAARVRAAAAGRGGGGGGQLAPAH